MKYILSAILFCFAGITAPAQGTTPVIKQADGFIIIKGAAMQPDKNRTYKAVYNATKAPKDSSQLLPALNMAGSELNALGASGIPVSHAKFVVVFHGAAIDGILRDEYYQQKYGIDNPNLAVLAALKKAGVKLFVCGQNLLAEKIGFTAISPDVTVASDALIVLMSFQNDGYALMSF